ncbi:PaaI family thioesterase [Rhodoligotrophos defluvii]|uniref:PaaI family thioesterase n=1 Tax=Rhodoligotrophos defluvii TaxID=2561934 RepID=UPI0010C94E7D|nr:PaaI family thioesterase [Rhodoligotrophos defluvii]
MTERLTTDALHKIIETSPFIRFLGLTIEAADHDAGEITMKMPMRAELERSDGTGQVHGGPIAALIDTVGDFAVILTVGAPVPTINFRTDYLRPAGGAYLIGKAKVRRAGRTVAVVDIDVFDDQGRLCAVGRGCYGAKAG